MLQISPDGNATSKSQMFLTIMGVLFIQSVAVGWYDHIWYNSNQYAQGYLVSWINLQFSPRAVKAIYLFKTELKYTNQSSNLLVLTKCTHIVLYLHFVNTRSRQNYLMYSYPLLNKQHISCSIIKFLFQMKLVICRKQVCSQSGIVLSDRSANDMNKI